MNERDQYRLWDCPMDMTIKSKEDNYSLSPDKISAQLTGTEEYTDCISAKR